jgi:hypothetical protein
VCGFRVGVFIPADFSHPSREFPVDQVLAVSRMGAW